MDQYMEIISDTDAWVIAQDAPQDDEEEVMDPELKPTISARRVKALVEQVTGTWVERTKRLLLTGYARLQIVIRHSPSLYNAHAS